jgi:indolepyruvate ferredoxin oxidoreductase
MLAETSDAATRTPYFCSGCPHNISTKVPDGMRAYAGIGCHYMVQRMDRATEGYTQMGGEGANWIGEAPFSTRGHMIQNLGDGTYDHSGVLPIRWAIAAGVNITFKILFNDAVAMTGGQNLEGDLTVDKIARQVAAEGASKIVVVTNEPGKYSLDITWPERMAIAPREDLDRVQRELAATSGTTVLIYDQICAAEKRRRRKRGLIPHPDCRVIINELVCEGCGDCGIASNCVAVQPIDTEFGRKRRIDQSSCNKDFSCLDGFCPAFVTVHGGKPKVIATKTQAEGFPPLPHPNVPVLDERPFSILITGVGGTGVVTIGAFLAMAAHLEGKRCGSVDMAGLAQKGGSVYSHIKIAASPKQIHAISIAAGGADLVLGCDLVVSGSAKVLAALRPRETGVVVNTAEIYPGDFARDADFTLPADEIKRAIIETAGEGAAFFDATGLSTSLFGTSIAANIILVGFAWQRGLLPLSEAALMRAIELNDESVDLNKRAFLWGRRAAFAPEKVAAIVAPEPDPTSPRHLSQSFDEVVERRSTFLTAYQNEAYAASYVALVRRVAEVERRVAKGARLSEAVARNLFKLMAVKDEYEVARLFSDGSFAWQVAATFEGDVKLEFHLAPPILGRRNAKGELKKMSFGLWMMRVFKLLAKLKRLRGTPVDMFGWSRERRTERKLLEDYKLLLDEILTNLMPENHACAVALAALPDRIRGFGHVKLRNIEASEVEEAELLARFRAAPASARVPVKLAAQ